MWQGLLFTVYTLFFVGIFYRWSKLYSPAWKTGQLPCLFLIKLFFGCTYVYSTNLFFAPDALVFFEYSKQVTEVAFTDFYDFLRIVFLPINHELLKEHIALYDTFSVWYNSGSFLMVRIHSILNLLSSSNHYINLIFWNVLSTIGIALLWNAAYDNVAKLSNWTKVFLCFSPEMIFWASGTHKETIALFLIGLIVWSCFSLINKFSVKHAVALITGCLFLGLTRHYFLVMFVPCLVSLFILKRNRLNWQYYLLILVALLFVGVFVDAILLNSYVLDNIVIMRTSFVSGIKGNSDFYLNDNVNGYLGLILQTPYALFNAMFRPLIFDAQSPQTAMAVVGKWLVYLPIIYIALKFKNFKFQRNNFSLLLISYGVLLLLIIGLIVDNSGAIVRYRAIPLTLIVFSVLLMFVPNNQTN